MCLRYSEIIIRYFLILPQLYTACVIILYFVHRLFRIIHSIFSWWFYSNINHLVEHIDILHFVLVYTYAFMVYFDVVDVHYYKNCTHSTFLLFQMN